MQKGILLLLLLLVRMLASGQNGPALDRAKYWVYFKDKGTKVWKPEEVLSPKALERRTRHGIEANASDWPVDARYLQHIAQLGAEIRHPSKWFNAVSVWMDAQTASEIAALPFVKAVNPIKTYLLDVDPMPVDNAKYGYGAGSTQSQLSMIGLDRLHQNGLNGRGIVIAVLDNGFKQANINPHLNHLFSSGRILATHDFVNDEADVFDGGTHGQWVLSILAGWTEDEDADFNHYGSAHGASYILCHTENDNAETTQEEDNWVAAMEWADSIGADILSTSLSYRDFDGGFDYGYAGMDGNTAIITRGSDLAASKGMVVLNSAGNSGAGKIGAPADGDSVIAVGAVDSSRVIAGFSSRGPSYDQRVKPDVCAMGVQTAFIQSNGTFSRGNGTSFSCPVVSGFLACLLQAKPETRNMDLYDAMIRSAHLYDAPDSAYGYGIPNAAEIYKTLTGKELAPAGPLESWDTSPMLVYPNPSHGEVFVAIDNDTIAYPAVLEWVDARGVLVYQREVRIEPFYNLFRFDPFAEGFRLAPGTYNIRLRMVEEKKQRFTTKVFLSPKQ